MLTVIKPPRLLIAVALCFLLSISLSQAASPKSLLKDLKKKYSIARTFQAKYSELFEWAMTGEKVQTEGTIYIGEDDRFRLESPEQLVVCDGQAVYRWNRRKGQVMIEAVSESADKLLPRRLMLDFADEFTAVESTELAVDGKPGCRLDLQSDKPDELLMTAATVWTTSEDNVVRRLKFEDLNRNNTTYTFKEIVFDAALDSTLFQFTPPEGAEVFDLRE